MWRTVLVWFAFCGTFFSTVSYATNPQVETSLGTIEGTVAHTYTGKPFYQFEGVPFAAPPVGNLRFEKPQDPSKWEGVLMAKVNPECFQYSQVERELDGSYATVGDEDCLYYNVYTPTLNQSANLSVLVSLPGGAFTWGAAKHWGPDIILTRNVVYIVINYRVGPLGFLSTEDDVFPGNLGLWDQQQALKWIKKFVPYFGGNPNSITLHGLCAGSASVQLHCLLPGSKGLFQRAMGLSGSALNHWTLMENALEKTKKLASLVGCPTENSTQIKSCLKTKSPRLIVQNVKEFQPFRYVPLTPFSVVIDGNWSQDPILPKHPLLLLKNKEINDVPALFSHATSEGLYPGADFYDDTHLQTIDRNWNELMPYILMYNGTVATDRKDNVSQTIRNFYLGNQTLTKGKPFNDLIQMIGDRDSLYDLEKGLKLHSAGIESAVYGYVFNYSGNASAVQFITDLPDTDHLGVCHADDGLYVLRAVNTTSNQDDINMSNLLLDLTESFMKSGVPSISSSWKPLSKNLSDPLNLLKINRYDELIAYQDQNIGHPQFWASLGLNENENLLNITLGF